MQLVVECRQPRTFCRRTSGRAHIEHSCTRNIRAGALLVHRSQLETHDLEADRTASTYPSHFPCGTKFETSERALRSRILLGWQRAFRLPKMCMRDSTDCAQLGNEFSVGGRKSIIPEGVRLYPSQISNIDRPGITFQNRTIKKVEPHGLRGVVVV